MLRKLKEDKPEGILAFFRSGDDYETYYDDAKRAAEILNIELQYINSFPTILITQSQIDEILDTGQGVCYSLYTDNEGNIVPELPEEVEVLHLYDNE